MTKKQFLAINKDIGILGSFKNEHGEEFIIFRLPVLKDFLITGDEFDWEIWQLTESGSKAYRDFFFNREEIKEIKKIIYE